MAFELVKKIVRIIIDRVFVDVITSVGKTKQKPCQYRRELTPQAASYLVVAEEQDETSFGHVITY